MWGRIDDLKHNTGLSVCNNFIVLPQGPITARPGLRFVREVKDSSKFTRLIPFRYSATQTMMLEFGETYIRFHSFASTLLTPTSGVSAYDSGSTYDQGDLVTESGSTWYAVSAVPTSSTPSSNQYDAEPIVSATWSLTSSGNSSIPSGYTFEGTELPETATVGGKVAISRTVYTIITLPDSGSFEGIGDIQVVETTVYDAYDGVSSTSTGGYWYQMPTEYEIPTPYAESDLASIKFAQSGDVLTLTHPSYAPRELRRNGATDWTLVTSTFGSALSAPTISSVTPTTATSPSDTQSYSYVATTVSDDQLDESVASSAVSATNQLFDTGALNTINFGTSDRRNVYKLSGGLYGYIGQTDGTSLVDDNIAADVSRTPPLNQTPFSSDYPRTVAYFEQRKAFAGTTALPQNFWLTKTGTENNLDYSIPVRADDAISIKISALESSTIRHLVPLDDLIILTDSAEWRVSPVNSEALTPTTTSVRATSYIGANNVQPVVVSRTVVYAAARGGHIRGLGYDFEANSYVSVDLSLRAQQLFDYKSITDLSYGKSPTPIVWAVSSDGNMLGLSFVPEQQVYAWHTHSTENGTFESCAVIDEGDDSICYVIVNRTIDGATKRYVEAMGSRYYQNLSDFVGLDSSISYSGAATASFSNLDHLEGETVYALVDGAVQGPFTVSSGSITTDQAGEVVHVGIRRTADMKTLPLVAEMEAYAQALVKTIKKVTLRVWRSGRFFAGEDVNSLYEAKVRTTESYGDAPGLQSREVEVHIGGTWNDSGQIVVRTQDPTPLTVSSLTVHAEFGG
jgi:hypothetical protein